MCFTRIISIGSASLTRLLCDHVQVDRMIQSFQSKMIRRSSRTGAVIFLSVFFKFIFVFQKGTMSSTTSQSSTLIDDDLSLMVQDASETTVATQTSRSWHSVRSDLPMNNHLFIRSPTINHWLTRCSIEPDIRLTTAQEWKLRTCLRRFLLLCNHQLHFISVRTKSQCLVSRMFTSCTGIPTKHRKRIEKPIGMLEFMLTFISWQ